MTFSGGVAEYLYKRENRRFGDLGSDLAEELRHALAHRRDLPPVWDPGQGIRATVIGAAQFSVQISGNTILIADPDKLPLQNLPVLACHFDARRRGRRRRDRRRRARRAGPRRLRGRRKPGRARRSPGAAIPRMRGCTRSRPASARRCRERSRRACRWCC